MPEVIVSSVVSIRTRRRLAGAVRAEEPEDLARRDVEVDAAHGLDHAAATEGLTRATALTALVTVLISDRPGASG